MNIADKLDIQKFIPYLIDPEMLIQKSIDLEAETQLLDYPSPIIILPSITPKYPVIIPKNPETEKTQKITRNLKNQTQLKISSKKIKYRNIENNNFSSAKIKKFEIKNLNGKLIQ